MMKHFFTILLATLLVVGCDTATPTSPTLFAHRGCWSQSPSGEYIIPENSLPAVEMAKRMGYTGIECDVHYTKDSVMVILHDATLNRTMRHAKDYTPLSEPVYLKNLTFEELRRDYVMESTNPEWRAPIPTLEELLAECKRHGIVPMLHSALMPSYHVAQEMFGNEWICFTSGVEHMKQVRKFSDCTILLAINDGSAEENIARLEQIGGHCGISTMNYSLYTPQFCEALTSHGYIVQASIFPAPHEAIAQRNGITYQLTDFSLMPTHRPIDKEVAKGIESAEDANARWEHTSDKSVECGGVTVEVEYSGEVEIMLNGQKYELSSTTPQHDIIGKRLFDTTPTVQITAKQGGWVKKATTRIYTY